MILCVWGCTAILIPRGKSNCCSPLPLLLPMNLPVHGWELLNAMVPAICYYNIPIFINCYSYRIEKMIRIEKMTRGWTTSVIASNGLSACCCNWKSRRRRGAEIDGRGRYRRSTHAPRVARSSQTSDSIPVLDVFQGPTRMKSGQAMARMPDPVWRPCI